MHPTMWDKIRTIFNAMLRKVGFTRPITDNELRYQLWRSYQNLLESRDGTTNYFMAEAKDNHMQQRLGVGEFARTSNMTIFERAESEESELTDIDNPYYQPDILGEELYLDAVASEKPLTEKDEDVLLRPASIMNGEPTWDERNESFSEYARRYVEWAHDKQVYELGNMHCFYLNYGLIKQCLSISLFIICSA